MSTRQRRFKVLSGGDYTLTSGLHAYRGESAFLDVTTNLIVVGVAANANLLFLGFFKRECDASLGAATCQIEFPVPRVCEWFDNYASDLVLSTDVGSFCYVHTGSAVRHTSTSNSPAGLVMALSATEGVLVDTNIVARPVTTAPTITDFTSATHGHTNNAGGGVLAAPAITSFASATHGHTNAAGGGVLAAPAITSFASATHGHTNDAGGGVLAAPAITSFASATHTHGNAAGGGSIRWADGGTLAWTDATCTISTPGTWVHYRAPAEATQASDIVLGNTGATMGDCVKITSAGAITQTITYYDGTYARTAALSASKTHVVTASYDGAVWVFDAEINAN